LAAKKTVKKKLPTINSMSDKFGKAPAYQLMREDQDLIKWLENVFDLKQRGELHISHRRLADEVSEYLGSPVSHHVINKEYREWLLRNKVG